MRAMAAVVVVGLAALIQATPVSDPDLWWLLKTGEYMVATRSFPTVDPFTWTAQGAPWLNHTWGFELVLYGVYALSGFTGLIVLQVSFALATFAVMTWTLRRERVPAPWALGLIGVGALVTRGFWSPRPQVVTYLSLAILWAIVWEYREGRGNRLWWLPALMVLWVNLHGGFFIGLAVLGLAALGQALDRLFDLGEDVPHSSGAGRMVAVCVACVGAALLNPFHVRALLFPLHVSADRAAKDFIIEWSSPAFQNLELRVFESLLLFFLVAFPLAVKRPRLGDVAILVGFVHLTLDATRNIPLFVIVLTPLAGRLGAEAWTRFRSSMWEGSGFARPRAWAAVCLAGLAILVWFRDLGPRLGPSLVPRWGLADVFPNGAVDFLRANPVPGRFFNDYTWGGYLTWHLFPRYRVFIDGRIAIFPPDVREDFLTINNVQPGWQEALDRRDVGVILVRSGTAIAGLLRESAGWVVAYEDGRAVVFHRRPNART